MKKGQMLEGKVKKVKFPNIGVVETQEGEVFVKNVLPGQRIMLRVQKKRHGSASGSIIEIIEKAPFETDSKCPHFDQISGCGGCIYQTLPYEKQLKIKEGQVKELLSPVVDDYDDVYEGAKASPLQQGFRNKMEFSFGDEYKDGPLALGMHKRGGFYDIVTTRDCRIMDEDFRKILVAVLEWAKRHDLPFYHRVKHTGFLRHLLVRKASSTGQILIAVVTSSDAYRKGEESIPAEDKTDLEKAVTSKDNTIQDGYTGFELIGELSEELCKLKGDLEGKIAGILHIINDSVADVVKCDRMELLYGNDHFFEKLLGLTFRITPFSFFQTNTKGAEVLYDTVREYAAGCMSGGDDEKPVIFDLYSGTGTIAQILAPVADKVVGVEIVEEAVEAARENASLNSLDNCEFIAGDVLKVIDEISYRPDLIILDPPRDGIHPKALPKILSYGVKNIIYISCKPSSLARDIVIMREAGYEAKRICCVDMFPFSGNVETVVKLVNMGVKPDYTVRLEVDVDEFYKTVGEEKRHFVKPDQKNEKDK